MHIIIDGYNLLFTCFQVRNKLKDTPFNQVKKTSMLEQYRSKLIGLIKIFYQSRNERITIVFDGSTDYSGHSQESSLINTDYLTVLFSDKNITADDLIIKIAVKSVSESEVLVITSDNDVKQKLKPEGVKIVSSYDFMSMLSRQKDTAEPIASSLKNKSRSPKDIIKDTKKLYGISPEEAEKWMELFGFDSEDFSGKPD
jgi:predicted RNA-binding protein with PIN domain